MTSQEMMKHPPIRKDEIFVNISAVDQTPNWQLRDKPIDWDLAGNPNNSYYRDKLFGYDLQEFMMKQYK
jgi:hypothetical protein